VSDMVISLPPNIFCATEAPLDRIKHLGKPQAEPRTGVDR
jgi:hypothetical protein